MSDISVIIYYREGCGYSMRALSLLETLKNSNKIKCFRKYNSGDKDGKCFKTMVNLSKLRTYPQIFANGKHIGGYTDLIDHLKNNGGNFNL